MQTAAFGVPPVDKELTPEESDLTRKVNDLEASLVLNKQIVKSLLEAQARNDQTD